MNFDELIIDRPLRAHKYNFDGKRIWTMSNLKDLKLTLGGETVYSQDELGTNIMGFDRSKTASAEWSNALVHLGTMADQMGTEKQIASGTAKQKFTRVFFLTTADGKKLTLPHALMKRRATLISFSALRRLAKRPCPVWRLSLTVLRSPMLLP